MKIRLVFAAVFGLTAAIASGQGSYNIIKQRARDVSNQNNNRQVEPPPAAPAAPPLAPMAPTPAPVRPTVQQQNIARLKADLAAMHRDQKVTDQGKKDFAKDLLSTARGSGHPSDETLSRLSTDLSSAMTGKGVTAAADAKLVEKIVVLFNSAGLSPTRIQELTGEAQTALQSAGVPAEAAATVATDLQAIATDVQHTAHL